MTATLTDADDITLEAFYDDQAKQDWSDPGERLDIDRWSKYGHDRLYINSGIEKADKYGLYVDLQTHEIVSDNTGKHSGGSVDIDGDTATITIEVSGTYEHEITLSLTGDVFESDDAGDEDESEGPAMTERSTDSANPTAIADGGTDGESVEEVLDGGINKVIVRTFSRGYRFTRGGTDEEVTHIYCGTVENDPEIPIGDVPSQVFDALEDAAHSPNRETTPHPAGRDISLADSDNTDETDDGDGSEPIADGGEDVTGHGLEEGDELVDTSADERTPVTVATVHDDGSVTLHIHRSETYWDEETLDAEEAVWGLEEGLFERADGDDSGAVTDGGADTTAHVDDATIEAAIAKHDAPDHPEAATVAEVRDALGWLQQSIEEVWADWCSNIEHNESTVVYEDREVIVFSTGDNSVVTRDLTQHYDGELGERTPDIVSAIHHELARERCDYDWGYEYPLVIRKPDGVEAGQRYVEAVVNGLRRRGLSAEEAWTYYGVEIRGDSQNMWATRTDRAQPDVSKTLSRAGGKLR